MNKEELKTTLKPGEKAADILEYYYGQNGKFIVYIVTVYTCKHFLWFNYISKYTFPFYFSSKKVAEDYLQNIDKFKIDIIVEYDSCGYAHGNCCYTLIPKNIKKPHYAYRMESPYDPGRRHLHKGEIWNGYVDCVDINNLYKIMYNNEYFTEIEILEKNASIEGQTGKRYSYKLQQID